MFVKKHPNQGTLAVALHQLPFGDLEADYEQMNESELEDWKASEIDGGWVPIPVEIQPVVPGSVTSSQMEQWLYDNGKLETLKLLLDNPVTFGGNTNLQARTKIRYQRAVSWRRTDPMLVKIAIALGMTAADIDFAFREAEANYP